MGSGKWVKRLETSSIRGKVLKKLLIDFGPNGFLSFIKTIHRCDRAARAVYKHCIKTITEKNIHIALIGYLERETFMNPLHTLFPFKGFQYTPASISLHRESDRNLSTTLIHEKIIQKKTYLFNILYRTQVRHISLVCFVCHSRRYAHLPRKRQNGKK